MSTAVEMRCRAVLKPVDPNITKELTDMIKWLATKLGPGKNFDEPVAVKFEKNPKFVADYEFLVKQPMDLGTIAHNLERDKAFAYDQKRYRYIEEVAHDVRLVWKNALIFNNPRTKTVPPIFEAAKDMSYKFEERFCALHQRLETDAMPCPPHARCQLLLSDMKRNPLSEWFRRDDWRQFANYRDIVSSHEPMDLDQVQEWLDGQSASEGDDALFDEFERRVRLVWANALEFNSGEYNTFGAAARLCQDIFERRMKQIREAPRPAPPAEREPDREGHPAFERKAQMHSGCTLLPLREQREVAGLIERECAGAVSVKDGHATVDLDTVSTEAFEAAEAAVAERVNARLRKQLGGLG